MIAIISDIHGNYPALKEVLKEIDNLNCEKIICLGDIAGYYCMINECIEELKKRDVITLLGNHDQYLIQGSGCPRSHSATRCLNYQLKVIKKDNLDWLKKSQMTLSMGNIKFVHGGLKDPIDEYLYKISLDYFMSYKEKYFFSGHTHVQTLVDFGEKIYCNPGSVGQPRDGDPRAAFAIYNNGQIILKRVKYDINNIAEEMKKKGFETYFYSNLYQGTRLGGKKSDISII